MKRTALSLFVVAVSAVLATSMPLVAQTPAKGAAKPAEDMVAKREAKLKEPFLKKAPWLTDFDAAKAESKKTGKPIFTYLTRSYAAWGPCDALQAGALSDAKFPEFAKSVILFCHITSQVPDDKYQNLLSESGGKGFPHVVFMDGEGKVLATQGDRSVAGFEKTFKGLKVVMDLRAKAAGGDKAAGFEVLVLDLEASRVTPDDARKQVETLGPLTDAQKKHFDAALIDSEIGAVIASDSTGTPESRRDTATKLLELKKQGKVPTSAGLAKNYWRVLFEHGITSKDYALSDTALSKLRTIVAADPKATKDLAALEKRLNAAKAGK